MAVRDKNLYLVWQTMTMKEREDLYMDAYEGDKEALSLFRKISTSIRIETNKRIRELKKHGYDYGKAYDNLIRYLQIEQDRNTVPTMSQVNYDIDELMTINEQARKFLKSKYSDWRYREKRTQERIEHFNTDERFKGMFDGYTYQEMKDFLRWIAEEEPSYALDEYGLSDQTIVILAGAYHEAGKSTNGLKC